MLLNRSMPEQTLIPVLGYPDVQEAVSYLCDAFGFVERWVVGDHRAQLGVGPDAAVAITRGPGPVAGTVDHVMVRVESVDEHCARARVHGAEITAEQADYPYGERQYSVKDFSGRGRVFTESVADLAPEQWGARSGPTAH